jgi:peptidoglycan L-alanyl-D-glutamate endopeptidase CwlK
MKDHVTIDRIKLLHPKLRDEVTEIYDEICEALMGKSMCRFSYTLRTFAEQDALYAQGRTKPGAIVTNAKGGLSYHNYGQAIDIVLLINGKASWDTVKDFDGDGKADWQEVVTIFKQYGWEAGIDWKFRDAPHFQKTLGYSVRQLLALHQAGKVDEHGFVKI